MITPLSKYPSCLINELAKYGQKPTGDLDWDKCVLDTMKRRSSDAAVYAAMELSNVIKKANEDKEKAQQAFPNLSDPTVYELHSKLFLHIANMIVIEPQHREFIVDEHNEKVHARWRKIFSRSVVTSCTKTSCFKAVWELGKP